MAETNLDLRELQESIDRLSESLGSLSGLSAQASGAGTALTGLTAATNSSTAADKAREKVLTAAAERTASGLSSLAKAAGAAGSAMYNNQKGAEAFNSTIDHAGTAVQAFGAALMLLGGPLGLLAGGLLLLVGSGTKLVKTINQQSDAVYKGFQDLSRSGGAASDGMSGLFADAQKLGLGFQDLSQFTALVGESSKELALFGGSVSQGRKQFANMGQAMEPFRASLMNAGMTQEEINAASMGYLRLQTRIGQTQNKTTDELANGARKYLIEQDALTKLTGMTRKEQEDAREEIRSQERFAATLMEMRNSGDAKQIAAAQELEDSYLILRSQSKEAAQGFADVSTGMLTTEAAQKSYLATQGESMRTAERIKAGELNAAQGAQKVAAAHGRNVDAMGAALGKMGVYNQTYGDLAADLRLKGMSEGDIEKQLAKIKQDQIDQGVTGKKAADGATQAQTDLRLSQQKSMLALQRMVNTGVEPATTALSYFAKVVANVSTGLEKFLNRFGLGPGREITEAEQKANAELKKHQDEIMALERKRLEAKTSADKKIIDQEIRAVRQKATAASQVAKQTKKQAQADYDAGKPGGATQGPAQQAAAGAPSGSNTMTQSGLAEAGLKLRPSGGDIQKDNAVISPKLIELAKKIQDSVPGFNYFSGFNDQFHQEKSPSSQHTKGLALDFVLNRKPTVEEGQKIASSIQGMGGGKVIDEYNSPSAKATGGHIHVSIPEFAMGGIATGPKSGYPAMLHGTEAVIPLKNGSVPVSLSMNDIASAGMFGKNRGDAAGQMRGELAALKNMALSIAGSSQPNKPAPDVKTWQEAVKSSLSNNYENGLAEITSKMLPDIGNDIGEKIKEISKNSESTTASAIGQMTKDLRQSITDAIKNVIPQDSGFSAKQLELMSSMIQEQKNSNSIQEKLLRAAAS